LQCVAVCCSAFHCVALCCCSNLIYAGKLGSRYQGSFADLQGSFAGSFAAFFDG